MAIRDCSPPTRPPETKTSGIMFTLYLLDVQVLGEVSLNLAHFDRAHVRQEWDAFREHDVVFLISIQSPHVRRLVLGIVVLGFWSVRDGRQSLRLATFFGFRRLGQKNPRPRYSAENLYWWNTRKVCCQNAPLYDPRVNRCGVYITYSVPVILELPS